MGAYKYLEELWKKKQSDGVFVFSFYCVIHTFVPSFAACHGRNHLLA